MFDLKGSWPIDGDHRMGEVSESWVFFVIVRETFLGLILVPNQMVDLSLSS